MQILLFANQVQFELAANVLIFEGLVVANVFHQLVEHSIGVLASEHPLCWVPLRITHCVGPSLVQIIVFREEPALNRVRVRVLTPKVDHLDDLSLLALCGI